MSIEHLKVQAVQLWRLNLNLAEFIQTAQGQHGAHGQAQLVHAAVMQSQAPQLVAPEVLQFGTS